MDVATPDSLALDSGAQALHVLIVDDHTLIADMLEVFLAQLGASVRISKATTVLQALSLAQAAGDLNLALLDLRMPDMDGIAGLRSLRRDRPDLPIAIMSGDATLETVQQAMDAGANGFIPKTIGGAAILHALRLILAGERYFPTDLRATEPAVAPTGINEDSARTVLSPRERDVLAQLMEGRPNKEIARELGIEVVTVTLHLSHIYRKLGVSSRTQALRRALDLGLDRIP